MAAVFGGGNLVVRGGAEYWGGVLEFAVLAQVRTFSSARIRNRIGQMDEVDFARIKQSFIKLLDKTREA